MARPPSTFRQGCFNYFIGFVGCVLVPGFVTAIAPVSFVRLERHAEIVSAHVQTNFFFFIPYRQARVEQVISVDDRFHAGVVTRSRSNRSHESQAEDESFLILHGRDGDVEVSVSPASIDGVLEKAQTFLTDCHATELRLFTVANWKFSVLAGGFLSLFTVLYLVGVLLSAVQFVVRLIRK